MKQTHLDGFQKEVTCSMCLRLTPKILNRGKKVYKCKYKPRGFGYDLKKSHPACGHFRKIPEKNPIPEEPKKKLGKFPFY